MFFLYQNKKVRTTEPPERSFKKKVKKKRLLEHLDSIILWELVGRCAVDGTFLEEI